TVFYCEGCSEPFTEKRVLDAVVALFRQHTADVWYSKTAAELMGPDCKCSKCGAFSFRKETDILDVWFDSGSSHLAVLTPRNDLEWPSDMYIEGGDQYRGWFHSSLLIGVGLKGAAPYRECATHGWTLDAEGRAMSKSLGNNIEPETIVKQYGADLLRLWVASVDFTEDVRLSEVTLKRLSEAYRKLRNTFRYLLGNTSDFNIAVDAVAGERLLPIDTWVLLRAEELVRKCRDSYGEYAFHKVYRALYDFAVTDLSAVYFDILKDRLYTTGPSSPERRSGQTALYRLNLALTRLLAPILSFTCEEVWTHTKHGAGAVDSVHVDLFPDPSELISGVTPEQRKQAVEWDWLMVVREQVLKALDTAREDKVIGSSLEAAVTLTADGALYDRLEKFSSELSALFIVSQTALERGNGEAIEVKVERARGDKCERCWKYTADVGSDPDFPTVCAACARVLRDYF
ncbi:MAG TPA: class I tRNA ligase family protein, partial [Bryobacteraceae bacterium]|nr:class I tRNA ligase family protein [Bryobacteraceae bacterium]